MLFASVPATRLISSRDVQAIMRSASWTSASWSTRRVAPLPFTVRTSKRYESACSRGGVEIDDGDLVIAVQRFDDGRAHLPRADKDDLHGDGSPVPTQVSVSGNPRCYVESHSGPSFMPTASAIRFT